MYVGIIISVAALVTTFIIFEGYERTLKKTILGVNSHIYFFKPGVGDFIDYDIYKITDYLSRQEEVKAFSGIISGQAVANIGDRARGCFYKSIDWENNTHSSIYETAINEGTHELRNPNDIVIGKYLAQMLGVGVGDEIQVMSVGSVSVGMSGVRYRTRKMTIVGIFYCGMYEYDSRYIFLNRATAGYLQNNDGDFNMIEVQLKEEYINQAWDISLKWDHQLNREYQITTWEHFNGNLFSLLALEKWVLTIIISFLIVVASFNVITTTMASIIEKRKEIGLLKAIGLSGNKITAIFLTQISLISFVCIIIGIFVGIGIGHLISIQTMISLRGEVYLLDKIYIYVDALKMVLIFFIAFVIINVSSVIPLRQISKMSEIEILRYRQ
jgi:lipoprotein-releasing system permease protein